MPVQTAQKQMQRDGVRNFRGVNLRRDRLDMVDGDVARAINADLHSKPGVAILRLGRSNQFSASLNLAIRRLATHNGIRFQVAGTTLFRSQTSILEGLSTNLITTLQPFRHLNDTQEWVFVADDNLMRKVDESGNVRNWGIAAPSAAATIAVGDGTGLTGDYTGVYTYVRVVGSSVATESDPSPTPSAVTLTNQDFDIDVVASSDAQVTNIRIYRSAAGGTSHLFDQQVANTTATITSSQSDSALGTAVETDNEVPNNMSWVTLFQGHLFCCRDASNPHYLWWTKRFREEMPSGNFLEIGNPSDPLQGAFPIAGSLGVFTRNTKYRVTGNTTSGFTWIESLSSRGTPAVQAALVTSKGVLFPARDGLYLTNFLNEDVELSQAIESLFRNQTVNDFAPIDWNNAGRVALAEYKDKYFFSYPDTDGSNLVAVFSKDTGRWYHFDYGTDIRSLYVEEDVDDLVGGGSAGLVYILEDGVSDGGSNISLTLEPASSAGTDRYTRKLFQYVTADIDAKGGTVSIELFIDDVSRRTLEITGGRLRKLMRLPSNLMGCTWRVKVTYTGQEAVEIHSIQCLYLPLRTA